jgi:hypothetical protein
MSTLKLDTLLAADGTQTTEPSIPALDQRMAKAWVNFDGTGTVAIRSSYNVSSITDNTTGTYTVNFSSAFDDTNYLWLGSASYAGGGFNDIMGIGHDNTQTSTTTTYPLFTYRLGTATNELSDTAVINMAFFAN